MSQSMSSVCGLSRENRFMLNAKTCCFKRHFSAWYFAQSILSHDFAFEAEDSLWCLVLHVKETVSWFHCNDDDNDDDGG